MPVRPTPTAASLLVCAALACAEKQPAPSPVATPAPSDGAVAEVSAAPSGPRWLKGNTHTHTARSRDSHTEPADVVRWYTEHGYDFVVLTDHNVVGSYDGGGELLVMPGVELTHNPDVCDPPPPEPRGHCRVHVNALFTTVQPADKLEWTPKEVGRLDKYQRAFDQAEALGGMIQVNHPNWHWGVDADMLVELARRGATMVEIANQAYVRWNMGRAGKYPSMIELWDAALSAGANLWGVACDDAHNYYDIARELELRHEFGYPAGGGFVVVWAEKQPASIRAAMEAGRFYSSTGVMLEVAGVEDGEYRIEVAGGGFPPYRIRFVGQGGAELAAVDGDRARYRLADAPTGYVRGEVVDRYGERAWTQPVRVP